MSNDIRIDVAREVSQIGLVLASANSSKSAAVGCSALSHLTTVSKEMTVHAFPVTEWVFNMDGEPYTVAMKEGQLVATPYQPELTKEFCGVVAASREQAVNQLQGGFIDFCLFANEEGTEYGYTLVLKDNGTIVARPVNFTTGGAKNGGNAVFAGFNEFCDHSDTYANKYAVPVS